MGAYHTMELIKESQKGHVTGHSGQNRGVGLIVWQYVSKFQVSVDSTEQLSSRRRCELCGEAPVIIQPRYFAKL